MNLRHIRHGVVGFFAASLMVVGIAAPVYATEFEPTDSDDILAFGIEELPAGYFTVPIGASDPTPESSFSPHMVSCQVDGSLLEGNNFHIFNALCFMAEVAAVQDYRPLSSGASVSAVGNWIRWEYQRSTATRPNGSQYLNGWALGRAL